MVSAAEAEKKETERHNLRVKKHWLRPRLTGQIRAFSKEDAGLRAKIAKDNISAFFVHLYQCLYGGRIVRNPWGNNELFHNEYLFSPDIVRREDGTKIYSEVKATSVKNSKIHLPAKQTANNLFAMLEKAKRGERSQLEYGLFKYGPTSVQGTGAIDNSQLVRTLSDSEKITVVAPFNLLLYLASFGRVETRNQTSSLYNVNSPRYTLIKSTVVTNLFNSVSFDALKNSSYVDPFPVTKYFIPQDKYRRFAKSLKQNYGDIVDILGLRNLFEESKKIRDEEKKEINDLPF